MFFSLIANPFGFLKLGSWLLWSLLICWDLSGNPLWLVDVRGQRRRAGLLQADRKATATQNNRVVLLLSLKHRKPRLHGLTKRSED